MRKKIIAGNWKMNVTVPEAIELVKGIIELARNNTTVDIVVCPTYVCLYPVYQILKNSNLKLGAQDLYWETLGAYTGKISAGILASAGVQYVIIGHSEQRTYFGETDTNVNKKIRAALANRLTPIICVGETQAEREAHKTKDVIKRQVRGAYKGLIADDANRTIIAYEPVWAIGTGLTATPAQAQDVHAFIRNELLTDLFHEETASKIRIQYGGSMKGSNAADLLSQPDIDGGLIGGASLKAKDFAAIFNYAK